MVAMSEEVGKVSAALVKAQADVETAVKASTNPHYGSSYADLTSVLGVIKPALAAHGLAMVQYPGYEDGLVTMTTVLIHESGEWLRGPVASIPIQKIDPHGAASGVTYLRRYCASSLMALIADDDDGNAAVGPAPTRVARKPAAKKPAAKKKVVATPREADQRGLATLTALLDAVEEHGGVDEKTQMLGREIVVDGGPAERVEAAIRHLERELERG